MFELPYCSRYKAIPSSIVLLQQCSEVYIISSYSAKPLWNWLPLKYPTLTLLAGSALPLKCETVQYHQTICTVKSHSRALATFQNIGKTRKQGEAIW